MGSGSRLAGAVQQVDTDPCSNTNPRLLSWAFYEVAAGQDGPLFSSRLGRFDQFNLQAGTNCSMCVLCFHQRGEALPLRLGGLWLEVCTFGRAHTPLQETHRPPAISVSEMRQGLFQVRPPRSPYEETLMRLDDGMKAPLKKQKNVSRTLNKLVTYSFLKTTICLQAVVKQQDKLWCSRQKEHYSLKILVFLSRPIPSPHIVQVTRQDLSVRVVNFYERDQTGICLI